MKEMRDIKRSNSLHNNYEQLTSNSLSKEEKL
jgi:hypothetical protein